MPGWPCATGGFGQTVNCRKPGARFRGRRVSRRGVGDRRGSSPFPRRPGAEVVFARGREEPPGVGFVGAALFNSLQAKVHMPVGSYGINYPADVDPAKGANDMSAHVQSTAKQCPNTREVLGGYSLGAVAADLVIAVTKPGFGFSNPLPQGLDQNVVAVAMFGNGTRRILGPVPDFSPALPARRSTSAQAGIRSVRVARIGRHICSRHTSTPDWWIRPPTSAPSDCSDPNRYRRLIIGP
jgi:cutinase